VVDVTAIRPASPRLTFRLRLSSVLVVALSAILIAPIVAVFAAASGDSEGLWGHLFETVLAGYVGNTLGLMAGVSVVAVLFGVGAAWIVSRYDFRGRGMLDWALLLPAAVPAYIVAYTYTDLLEYAGPVQGALRDLFGWQTSRDYWFPEIRSMGGAIVVLGGALYPYVYMMTRIAFRMTPSSLFDAARIHRSSAFWNVALPLARPAIAAGLALVLMETVSDFGTVEYFALETLTLGIFNVWLGMNSLPAAAQIASVATFFVVTLLVIELYARNKRRFEGGSRHAVGPAPIRLRGAGAIFCLLLCLIPVSLGFLIPAGVLLTFVLQGLSIGDYGMVLEVTANSFLVAGGSAALILGFSAVIVLSAAFSGSRFLKWVAGAGAIGYAFPGTILAIGVLTFSGAIDDLLEGLYSALNIDNGIYLTGSLALVLIACLVRFQAVGYGAFQTGASRVPPNLLHAGRLLGRSYAGGLRSIVLPIVRGSALTGALLAFVDVMKELPMTLLLRPFNFETLATLVYQYAKDELLEQAALPALVIVLAGIAPVILMSGMIRRASTQRSG